MSCYHPVYVYWNMKETEKVLFNQPKMDNWDLIYKRITIPCGKCVGCKLDHSREWLTRLLMEFNTNKQGIFLTLTYNDENIPKNNSLSKKDFQNFIKRLRSEYPDIKFKYFGCGEYGSNTFRPHYHLILFGYDFNDEYKKNYDGHLFIHKKLEKIWNRGHVLFNFIDVANLGYTTRYTLKKAFSYKENNYNPEKFGLQKEFQLCSQKLGMDYFLLNKEKILANNGVMYFNGQKYNLPRYFLRKLVENGEAKNIKLYREKLSYNGQLHDDDEFLLKKEKEQKEKLKALRRLN